MEKIKIESKTKTNIPVTLTIQSCNGVDQVRADFVHPQVGAVTAWGVWGTVGNDEGIVDADCRVGTERRRVCITIPKTDYDKIIKLHSDAEKKEDDDRKNKALAEMPADCVLARQNWSNGDLMAAEYETEDGIKITDSDLLDDHYGWYFVSANAVAEAKAEKEEKQASIEKKEIIRKEKTGKAFSEAKKTGKKVLLNQWTEDCNDADEECSTDIIYRYAMPNGQTELERVHTY